MVQHIELQQNREFSKEITKKPLLERIEAFFI